MGIADMMIDGTLDSETGEYLGEGYGFPRTRNKKSHNSEKCGVFIFLSGRGFNRFSNPTSHQLVKQYCKETYGIGKKQNQEYRCEKIQTNFSHFVQWIGQKKYHFRKN